MEVRQSDAECHAAVATARCSVPASGSSDGGPWLQSRVSSATAFFAQSSSASALPAVVAAISAAMAALFSARGRPKLALWSRAMASSASSGSLRPASAAPAAEPSPAIWTCLLAHLDLLPQRNIGGHVQLALPYDGQG